jgi:hypothetical protein
MEFSPFAFGSPILSEAVWFHYRCETALDPMSQYGISVWMIDWDLPSRDL